MMTKRSVAVLLWLNLANVPLAAAGFVRPAVRWTQEPLLKTSWGQWHDYGSAGKAFYFQKLHEVGVQVYIQSFWGDPSAADNREKIQTDARFCQRYGLKFLPGVVTNTDFERNWAREQQVRLAVNAAGQTSLDENPNVYMPCPLAEEYWDFAYTQRALALARLAETEAPGIVGMHIDPEHYSGVWTFYRGPHTCYCDRCFEGYLRSCGRSLSVPPTRRYRWLERRGELPAYWRYLEEEARFLAGQVERRVHQRYPDFLFAAYPGVEPTPQDWFLRGMARGLHAPSVPLIVFDASHYNDIDWSRSSDAWYRQQGMVHLEGHWIERIEQNCREIPLAQIFGESGLHADGYWVWWEDPLTDAQWNALAQANQWLAGIADKVGVFLRNRPDERFVWVEVVGDDLDWDGIVWSRTYHLGDRHLLHLSNVSLEEAAFVRVRWPKLAEGSYWLLNPIAGKAYAPGPTATWTAAQLREGVPTPLEARSETFLLLQPAVPNGPTYPLGATAAQVQAHESEREQQYSRQTAGAVTLSQPLDRGLIRIRTAAQEVWINPVRGGQVWRWHEKQNGNELVTYDHGGLYGCGLFKDVLLPGEAGLVEAAESYTVIAHEVTPDRAVVVLERHLTPAEEQAAFASLYVRKTITVENAEPRLTVDYRLTHAGEGSLTGHLTLRHAPRLAERALRAAGSNLHEGLGLVVPTPKGVAYHAFLPQSLVYETRPEVLHGLSAAGFAQYCALTKEGVRWEIDRGQLERLWFWKPLRETYVMDYQPFTLGPQETWETTLSVVYEPRFELPQEW